MHEKAEEYPNFAETLRAQPAKSSVDDVHFVDVQHQIHTAQGAAHGAPPEKPADRTTGWTEPHCSCA